MNQYAKYVIDLVFIFSHLYSSTVAAVPDISAFCPDGLNDTHIRTLVFIDFNEGAAMTEISRRLELEKGSFTPVAKKLMAMGYVQAEKTKEDKRKVLLRLTPQGQALAAQVKDVFASHLRKTLSVLTARERRNFFNHISEIYRLLLKVNRMDLSEHPYHKNMVED